jgi:fructose-1,6-bisphosphatase II / sedoheptulose-1,7-bisphosphatase
LLNRILSIEIARVTEAAAIAAAAYRGRGEERQADQVAVDAMRSALNRIEMQGTVVIGEGERDEAPMLFIGEKVGTGEGQRIDIALDPLEGTTLTAKQMPDALSVIAMAEGGSLLHAPDCYMDKIAIGGGYPDGLVDLDLPPGENIRRLAEARGVATSAITACILDRPRHAELIAAVR